MNTFRMVLASEILPPSRIVDASSHRRPLLGEFEHQVMVAVQNCEEAYGLRIAEALLKIYGNSLAIAQVYVTLSRLEKKGFLSSQTASPRSIRGGRARRIYKLEDMGDQALEQSTVFRRALAASGNTHGGSSEANTTERSRSSEDGAFFTAQAG